MFGASLGPCYPRLMFWRSIAALCAGFLALPADAMTFTLVDDPCGGGNGSSCAPRIFGQGRIEGDDAQRLRQSVATWKRQGSFFSGVTLSSPGGSLVGGMLLGEEIRRLQLDTYAESSITAYRGATGPSRVLDPRVECHSACVYAFLGGVQRQTYPDAVMGIHQFASTSGSNADPEGSAQVTVVALREYVRQMGAASELVDRASLIPARTIHVLTRAELSKYRVDNTVTAPSALALQALSDGSPYLQNTHKLPDGRKAIVRIVKADTDFGLVVGLYIPRVSVSAERFRNASLEGTRPEFKLRTGFGAIPVRTERAWTKIAEDAAGITLGATGRISSSYLQALTGANALHVLDDSCSLAAQDVCLMSLDVGVEGLHNGLRLLARSR